MSLLLKILGTLASVHDEPAPQQDVRRGPPYACAGCKRWASKPLAFLNNGQSYCLDCARKLAESYGYRLVGKRADDIKALDAG